MNDTDQQFGLHGVTWDHPALQVAMPLISYHEGLPRCIGTGFAVAPGLAITAAHVIKEWMRKEPSGDGSTPTKTSVAVQALQWCEGRWNSWVARTCHACHTSDIGFIEFHQPPWWGTGPGQVNPRCARLNFNPPSVGDSLLVFGYPQSSIEERNLVIHPSESKVRVSRVDLLSEMGGYRPRSHIDVDGTIAGGMSGGPCFDRDWNVVGVNSKGWELSEGTPLAHVALLWPAMNYEIDLFRTGSFPVADLFKSGPARALGYRRLHVTADRTVLLGTVDPESLVPWDISVSSERLLADLNFAGNEAQHALAALRDELISEREGRSPPSPNVIHRLLRTFFWELDCTLRISVKAACLRSDIEGGISDWDCLALEWKKIVTDQRVLDECAKVDFAWNSIALFETRRYAEMCKAGVLHIQAMVSVTKREGIASAAGSDPLSGAAPLGWQLTQCRVRGGGRMLPDGLDVYLAEGRRFVPKVLRAAEAVREHRATATKGKGSPDEPGHEI